MKQPGKAAWPHKGHRRSQVFCEWPSFGAVIGFGGGIFRLDRVALLWPYRENGGDMQKLRIIKVRVSDEDAGEIQRVHSDGRGLPIDVTPATIPA